MGVDPAGINAAFLNAAESGTAGAGADRPAPRVLSWHPRIFLHERLLTGLEADYLVEFSRRVIAERPSTNMGPSDESRTSSTFWMNSTVEQSDARLRALVGRLHEAATMPVHHQVRSTPADLTSHTVVSGVGSRMPAASLPAPLARTKGLPVDASEKLPDDLVEKWQSEKVEI